MQRILSTLTGTFCALSFVIAANHLKAADPSPAVFNHVRFFPAPGREQALVGGRFAGSNVSPTVGFNGLSEIKETPKPGLWGELQFANTKPYRWIRYEAPTGSHGDVAELEFYAGERKLDGAGFGSDGQRRPGGVWKAALDAKPETFFSSHAPDGQYVGLDLQEQATARRPAMVPRPGDYPAPLKVSLKSSSGAAIRYTLDGTTPDEKNGLLYTAPIPIERTSTIVAVTCGEGLALSPASIGTYLVGPPPVPALASFHVGNSLTGNAGRFPFFALTAGIRHEYHAFLIGGASVARVWERAQGADHQRWLDEWNKVKRMDLFTMQPREFNIPKEAEAAVRFLKLVREKSPDVQPWLFAEWVERERQRPTDKGLVPSSQMQKLWPALTWEESMGAMLLYVEELQREIHRLNSAGKPVRVIPCCLAMGWINNMIDHGRVPGVSPDSLYPLLFSDGVHVNLNGSYLVDLTWYAAFYKRSPENEVLPVSTNLTTEQARVLQRLAWDVVKNYPDSGLYEVGATPAGTPQVLPPAGELEDVAPTTLSSTTPGAWFRYTLDGTTPTRTRGYVYCGVISLRTGMTLKAVAFKSGWADSSVLEVSYPARLSKQ